MERICPCGVGHPDPDHLAYVRTKSEMKADWQAVHGCCGCCSPLKGEAATYDRVTQAVAKTLVSTDPPAVRGIQKLGEAKRQAFQAAWSRSAGC